MSTNTGGDTISEVMRLLNDNPNDVYTLSFNSYLQAWSVLRFKRESVDQQAYKILSFSNSHIDAATALRDAIILKHKNGA